MLDLWGKEKGLRGPYPLLWHLVDTAAAAYVLWDVHLPAGVRAWIVEQLDLGEDESRLFVALLAGLHDVGKACPCFQAQWPERGAEDWIHHATVSYLTLPDLLRDADREYEMFVRSSPYRIAELLGGHHGAFQPPDLKVVRDPASRQVSKLGGSTWQDKRRELVMALRALLGEPELPKEIPGPIAGVLTGLVILADWIVSDTKWINESQWEAPNDPVARWSHTVAALQDRVPALGLLVPELRSAVSAELLVGEPPNPLQESIEREFRPTGAGLLVMTASTGYGKTEAAFLGVHRFGQVTGRPGMVVCLPTQATTNAMWRRGDDFAKKVSISNQPVTLVHGESAFHEPYREYCADDAALRWLNGSRKALLAGMSVVTVDQVLVATLATKFNMLRLWSLLGKTVVIDEVHAADPYMLALLARLLSWCGHLRVSVILLSATLPRHITRELTAAYLTGADPKRRPIIDAPDYPSWLFTSVDGEVQRPSVVAVTGMREHGRRNARIEYVRYILGGRIKTIIGYLTTAAARGGCVAVVCSTVASAQMTYQRVRASLPADVPMWLLHSRFPQCQRQRTENDVISRFGKKATIDNSLRPAAGVVVSTSIIEQSLDVDFDLVISDLVPIALLIQRLGRAWRHDRDQRPDWIAEATIVVLDPLVEKLPATWTGIYPEYELAATRTALAEHGAALVVPDDVDGLVQRVHDKGLPPIDGDDATAWAERHATTALHKALAGYVTIPAPHMLGHLCELTKPQVEDSDAATRLGIDNARLIPQYTSDDGRLWLDPGHTHEFKTNRPSRQRVVAMIEASVSCPASWVQGWDNPFAETWKRTPLLDAILFPAPEYGGLRLDSDLGLVKGTLHDDL